MLKFPLMSGYRPTTCQCTGIDPVSPFGAYPIKRINRMICFIRLSFPKRTCQSGIHLNKSVKIAHPNHLFGYKTLCIRYADHFSEHLMTPDDGI